MGVNVVMKNVRKQTLVLLCVAALVASVGSVVAWSALTSNDVTVIVNPEPTSITLIADKTTATVGDTITFTATLNEHIAGVSVQLYFNGVAVGSPVFTNLSGVAVLTYQVTESGNGVFRVTATPP